jgi:hypothetical protein
MNRTSAARKLNPQRYARLLAQQLPTVIRTEEEDEEMLAAIWELMKKGEDKLSAEELALLELMSVLVERFEEGALSDTGLAATPDSAALDGESECKASRFGANSRRTRARLRVGEWQTRHQ